jgi:chromosomal replication initiator protein
LRPLKDYIGKSIYITNDIQKIQKAVADYYKITVEDLKSKKRTANINYPRQIAMYLCRMTTEETIVKIGLEFGNRDHSTVLTFI